jgi:ribosomal protein L37AE/L43A
MEVPSMTEADDFKAHCPRCNSRSWISTESPDVIQCAKCKYLFALRGEPVATQPEAPAGTVDETSFHDHFLTGKDAVMRFKRERVRQLVLAMLSNPSYANCVASELVIAANVIDDEIENFTGYRNA